MLVPVTIYGANLTQAEVLFLAALADHSYTDGQLIIGNSSTGGISFNTLTQGSGITITNGHGTVTITATGGGTVTTVSVASANGFAGTVANATTTPAITLTTSVTGILQGNGTAISAATTTGSGNLVLGTSPTLSSPVVGTQTSTDNSTLAASTAYVTTAVSNALAGVQPQEAVQYATTTAGNTSGLTYNNGVSGIGATFTGANNTAVTIDGHTFVIGDVGVTRLLVKNDTQSPSGAFNGVYLFTALQTAGTGAIFTRALNYNSPAEMNNSGLIPVENGTANASTTWVQTATIATVGTTPLVFAQFSYSPTSVIAPTLGGTGIANNAASTLTISGNFATTVTVTNTTAVTLPTSGTLVNTAVATLSSLVSVGTITTGGLGTGAVIAGVTMTLGSDANYDTYYRNSSGILTRLANGTTGQFLAATTSSAPSWGSPSGSGTVNSGTAGQAAYYATSTTAVSGSADVSFSAGNITVNAGGVHSGQISLAGASSGSTTITSTNGAASGTLTLPSATDTLVGKATTDTLTNKTLTTPVINGTITGTGQATAATASVIAMRDSSANLSANNFIDGFATTATAAGTTALTIASTGIQVFTGSTTQTVTLPTTSVVAGGQYTIINKSTGAVTVQSSGANTITILAANTSAIFTSVVATPTTAANWNSQYFGDIVTSGKSLSVSNTLTLAGTDTTTMTFPSTSATIARTDAGQTFTGTNAFGVITATTLNGNTFTTGTYTLTGTAAKTLNFTNTLTLSGTDSTTMTFPSTSATVARTDAAQTFTGTQTFSQIVTTNNAITATSNAATVPITSRLSTVTNSSAATLTITMTTTSAVDGQLVMVRILDSSAVAQTITWVNTENSTVTAPTTSNGSTTLFLTVGFIYNSGTSKWRCIASA